MTRSFHEIESPYEPGRFNETQDRAPAHGHAEDGSQPGTIPTSQCETDCGQGRTQTARSRWPYLRVRPETAPQRSGAGTCCSSTATAALAAEERRVVRRSVPGIQPSRFDHGSFSGNFECRLRPQPSLIVVTVRKLSQNHDS
ncbi:hypothetical protein GCM10018793_55170 [Streptomyces sulfonofaciens]|uniref:Uncharacterized protein n=1 Tax=Streptomyces sulfonofaciens TaxID=68272 RepID=A0A919GJW8_9ACTN|nr:hypothetical protein GCM10018793_55170 [Streptomyces sulfonofaciens]